MLIQASRLSDTVRCGSVRNDVAMVYANWLVERGSLLAGGVTYRLECLFPTSGKPGKVLDSSS